MRYIEIRVNPSDQGDWPDDRNVFVRGMIGFLRKAVSLGNPDIEELIDEACFWWLEVDDDGLPHREFGFNAEFEPIVIGPISGNHGFLIDASDDWSDTTADAEVGAGDFEKAWNCTWPKFEAMDERSR